MHSSSTDRSSELGSDVRDRFLKRAGLGERPSLWELVESIREIPYGRPAVRTPEGVVEEWRGTCSTKHALLATMVDDRPELELEFVHRVYRIDRAEAEERFGARAAALVGDEGVVDVHTYAYVTTGGDRLRIDVTFPGVLWDGHSDMPLHCGEGDDYLVGDEDPWAMKDRLVAEHCDPAVREPFIAALSK